MDHLSDLTTTLKAKIVDTPDGVELQTDVFGRKTREFYDLRASLVDRAIRQKLIDLGWTPPPEV